MATEEKKPQQFDKIGGWLWFPAIWTVTNFPIAAYLIKVAPVFGGILMALAIVNAYLFWTRKRVYRWFFVVHSFAGIFVLAAALGPDGVGGGSVWALIFMVYLIFSKRARGTFIQPLFKKPQPTAVVE
jgi:hypothetical protein